jgi:hypothetical protein
MMDWKGLGRSQHFVGMAEEDYENISLKNQCPSEIRTSYFPIRITNVIATETGRSIYKISLTTELLLV